MTEVKQTTAFDTLIEDGGFLIVPKKDDVIKGRILSTIGRKIIVDIGGMMVGIVRGRELASSSDYVKTLNVGDEVEATVVEEENENGEVELSFRQSGNKRAWKDLSDLSSTGDAVNVKVLDANKGGLLVKIGNVNGFLPVSQLAPEHYPRVAGGDKQKILDKLKSLVGTTMRVRILDAHEDDDKLIVSEKAVWEDEQKNIIAQCHVGDIIAGDISAIADFGVFVKFHPTEGGVALEGLVHISEIAWQRIDHPKDVLKINDNVRAEIIGIEGSKIFLSMKKLIEDPWKNIARQFKIGEWVEGKIVKINPFGFFVEIAQDIQGLAHLSELAEKPVDDANDVGKIGDIMKFRIVSIEANEHRLGLSLKKG